MKLGAYSISLSVKDLQKSKTFYEKLGFDVFAGELEKNYLILKNDTKLIGLFRGMFENNILTFNSGWDENAKKLDTFDDVRIIQQALKKEGIQLESEIDETTSGSGNVIILDPDGNTIFLDKHV